MRFFSISITELDFCFLQICYSLYWCSYSFFSADLQPPPPNAAYMLLDHQHGVLLFLTNLCENWQMREGSSEIWLSPSYFPTRFSSSICLLQYSFQKFAANQGGGWLILPRYLVAWSWQTPLASVISSRKSSKTAEWLLPFVSGWMSTAAIQGIRFGVMRIRSIRVPQLESRADIFVFQPRKYMDMRGEVQRNAYRYTFPCERPGDIDQTTRAFSIRQPVLDVQILRRLWNPLQVPGQPVGAFTVVLNGSTSVEISNYHHLTVFFD